MISSYVANLTAFLTVSQLHSNIESLEDLARQYKVKYGVANNTPMLDYFRNRADIENAFYEKWRHRILNFDNITWDERQNYSVWQYPLSDQYTRMLQFMLSISLPKSSEDGVERVRNSTLGDEYAFISNAHFVRYQEMTHCDLRVVGEEFTKRPVGLMFQIDSPLTKQFNKM